MSFWRAPDVLLTQTCGYPYMMHLQSEVQLLATPEFEFPDCEGSSYRSLVVVPDNSAAKSLQDLRGQRVVINQPDSQSGMNALRHIIAPLAQSGRFFSSVQFSGSHKQSLLAVQRGLADVAAVDCVSFAYLMHHAGESVAGLRVLARTNLTAGLPLISSRALTPMQLDLLRQVLQSLTQTHATLLRSLRLKNFIICTDQDYQFVHQQAAAARQLNYAEIA
jgi:ABC-type phosphate/phosphonate transport system substrate-binding protein